MKALLKTEKYSVRAVTRTPNSEKAQSLASLPHCTIWQADLDDSSSLDSVLSGCYGAFLVTDFTAHFTHKEVKQGVNFIDSAIKNNLTHIVFSGLENASRIIGKPCLHLDYKAEIEEYGLSMADKINFTSVRLPCYFENFRTFAHKFEENKYVVNLPMNHVPMFSMSVDDLGECVLTVFDDSTKYKSKLIGLAAEKLTQSEYVALMNKHLAPKQFFDGDISLENFLKFEVPGVEDLGAMFEYFQTNKMERDIELTRSLNKNLMSFSDWLVTHRGSL